MKIWQSGNILITTKENLFQVCSQRKRNMLKSHNSSLSIPPQPQKKSNAIALYFKKINLKIKHVSWRNVFLVSVILLLVKNSVDGNLNLRCFYSRSNVTSSNQEFSKSSLNIFNHALIQVFAHEVLELLNFVLKLIAQTSITASNKRKNKFEKRKYLLFLCCKLFLFHQVFTYLI